MEAVTLKMYTATEELHTEQLKAKRDWTVNQW